LFGRKDIEPANWVYYEHKDKGFAAKGLKKEKPKLLQIFLNNISLPQLKA